MRERHVVYVEHRRGWSGCGGLLFYWLALIGVYELVGITGVWIVLGLGVVLAVLAAIWR